MSYVWLEHLEKEFEAETLWFCSTHEDYNYTKDELQTPSLSAPTRHRPWGKFLEQILQLAVFDSYWWHNGKLDIFTQTWDLAWFAVSVRDVLWWTSTTTGGSLFWVTFCQRWSKYSPFKQNLSFLSFRPIKARTLMSEAAWWLQNK